ncbi:MAG: EAL domain-containing protein [Deltaproteobacteria bacterium]|jgi:EAL domain-containing protein (putative c-di-GMP-specific phosphodiesterase class I)|nr:EAL domain-containing protein [Deltaproteobacteria bacterium]
MTVPDLKAVVPFFQPIIKTSDLGVFGYEVLARELHDGKIRSLGPYFEDPAVSDQDKLILDICVRERAFAAYAASGSTAKLFINLKPSWVYDDKEQNTPQAILSMLDRYRIDPQNIVVEVTEEELLGDSEVFGKLLTVYRKAGCMLAIDDFGKGESSVERIAHVMPDIIKLDHSIVRKTDTHRSFYEICRAMGFFGDISGFDLLFEGVETPFQLERCVRTGWCYVQGYVFSPARPGFETDYANRDLLADILTIDEVRQECYRKQRDEILAEMESEVERLRSLLPLVPDASVAPASAVGSDFYVCADNSEVAKAWREPGALEAFAKELPYYCVRCCVCDQKGRRLSNIYQLGGDGTARPLGGASPAEISSGVFRRGMNVLHGKGLGYLSDPYKNVATKENVATYMHRLCQDRLLCVDIISTAFI